LAVTEGDFNRDGVPDLAVADSGSGTVSVLLGNDDGTFQTALAFPAGNGPESVAIGDFNSDGELDLAVTNPGSATVSVLLGNGDGTFQAPLTFGAGGGASSVALGDLNADGKLDLAVAPLPWSWTTSTAMECRTWPWPARVTRHTTSPIPWFRCFWGTAMGPSMRHGPSMRAAFLRLWPRATSMVMARWIWRSPPAV